MSCNANKIDIFRLIQNSYKSITLSFQEEIKDDVFELVIFLGSEEKLRRKGLITEFKELFYVTFPQFELEKNSYRYEVIWKRSSGTFLIQHGKYKVTNEPQDCGCNSESETYTVNTGDQVTEVQFFQTVIGEGGGTPGPKGDPGLSAYQIAVQNGFVGTELQWLESLKGNDGQNGEDGKDGSDGENGLDGKSAYEIALDNGFVGSEQDWLASVRGSNGADGKSILQGADIPSSDLGAPGDTYINTSNGDIYLRGATRIWSLRGNIKGPKGDTGATGATGPAGTTTWSGINDKPTTFPPPVATPTTLGGVKVWYGTQTAYDAITTKATDVLYFIEG